MIDKILSRAKDIGVTQAHICAQLGLNRTWLQSVKHYNLQIDDERAETIASILHTTVAYLKGETDDPSPENKKSPSVEDERSENERTMLRLLDAVPVERQAEFLATVEQMLRLSGLLE